MKGRKTGFRPEKRAKSRMRNGRFPVGAGNDGETPGNDGGMPGNDGGAGGYS